MINDYQTFLLIEHQSWIDKEIINESIVDNISLFLKKTLKKMSGLSLEKKKTLLIYALSSLLAVTNSDKIYNSIINDSEIYSEIQKEPELEKIVNDKLVEESSKKDPVNMRLSKQGWNKLKLMEGDAKKPGDPVLTAYELGDGRITIGWGHAEPVSSSKYKVGQKITRREAQKLLQEDATLAADGVRRIFKEWKKDGIERKLTQDQFDSLVSMAFNMGVSGLRKTQTINAIKNGEYKKAGEFIKSENISSKFEKGLEKRRKEESEMFLSYLN